ncbi:MAG: Gfo/Idh/MocA family oxidoreductase [Kiritimatiellae bacterium]|nr:Gfo/Idh/MocA family oxidoreductase [Kiritimatiellia bacterium]
MTSKTTRRNLLKIAGGTAAVYAAPFSVSAATRRRSIGANDRIRIGVIGCGGRGRNAHMKGLYAHVKETNFEIVALSDPWRIAREQANGMVKEWFGRDAQQFVSYRQLLECKDLDAVTIASCDVHHTAHLEAAAKAGLHIYCEKPLAVELPDLIRAVDAVKAAGTVVQIGTQIRSLPSIVGARDLFRTGVFGKLSRVEECRNSERPYWYHYLKGNDILKEEDVDWKEFLHGLPMRPFRADIYSGWYGHYEFSRGPIPNLGAHYIDLVHFITGATFPTSCVCLGTISPTWKDEHNFTNPNSIQATWIYPGDFVVSSSNNLANGSGCIRKLYGEKGALDFTNWNKPTYDCEGAPRRDGSIRGKKEVTPTEHPDHFLNWLQCMRSGQTPNASIDAGYQHAVAVIMAMKSYETGRKTFYDPVKREITYA